ncbi:ParB family chromosome partitioning protein [Litoreibacter ponti]|uniref:ParB family chromosome partitioning protein n=1 Tax=Litoreibacter ponti TaxID=1510457 RepID=A0A2T6BCS3_9RHOB|nr:plasmid partitioning protein RepB [Litoreibacter ponti]PTX53844.1 ParB family chromosome partitioning protein [Litoreibacter ponti]
MARKGILSSNIQKGERSRPSTPISTGPIRRGTVGALQSSLTKLQEGAVQEIDPGLIDDAGIEDRLGLDTAAQEQLKDSLQTYGQQVPVLLRPHGEMPGRYEIVYGRRRLAALRDLGLPVKAMIRQLDDHELVLAQGQENTARQDLSFIEKASFAAQLQEGGYDRQTIAAALSIDLPMVSRLLKIGTAFELEMLRQIGSAPGIGRDRWFDLVRALEKDGAMARVKQLLKTPDFRGSSDARFELVLARALQTPSAKPKKAALKARTLRAGGQAVADIKAGPRGVTLTVQARNSDGFDQWINAHADALIQELHDRFKKDGAEEQT